MAEHRASLQSSSSSSSFSIFDIAVARDTWTDEAPAFASLKEPDDEDGKDARTIESG